MSTAPAVLLAVATELAAQAKESLPKLNEGEEIKREWYENGTFYRETTLFCYQYDFKQRKIRRVAVAR